MADIYISYSIEDKPIVKQIAENLEDTGWTVSWERQTPASQQSDIILKTEFQKARCVLVIWTKHSLASDLVLMEAGEAAQKRILAVAVLEKVDLPQAFINIESANLIGWNGEKGQPEISRLCSSIANILGQKHETVENTNLRQNVTKNSSDTDNASDSEVFNPTPAHRIPVSGYGIITITGFVLSLALVYYYLQFIQGKVTDEVDQRMFYLILILFGISASALVFGVMNTYAVLTGKEQNIQLKMTGPGVGVILIVLGGLYLPHSNSEKNVTIRVFDWKKNPVTQGDVKIYLNEYIRTESIDKRGQALFNGIPADMVKNKMKIEVSSPGYATRSFDTLVTSSKPLELTLPLTTVVHISGKVKTAAEIPIKGVEIDVDGTRYYAVSITDGSYNLRLEEYTLGDEITLTTSHKNYEDKTISLFINSPEIKQDIFLNPVSH